MRRLMNIAAFALFLVVPVWAQHGGGHGGGGGGHAGGFGGGGGHAGFSGGSHASGYSGGGSHVASPNVGVHAYSGPRSQAATRNFASIPSSHFSSQPRFTSRAGFSNGPYLHDGFRGQGYRNGYRNFGFRYGYRNNCFGYGCQFYGYPGWYAGYWDPWWWWNSDADYDQDYNDNLALAEQMNEQSLEEQQMLQQEQADGDQDAYARSAPPAREAQQDGAPFMPATVLVFRDQHRREVDNYAIVGQTLWVFAPKQAERIPLTDLDVAATVKANEDRGVTFRLPIANEGQ
jgi:hypothetical protein